ncbi:unnamed protein product [Cyprideis torosa]|uniref:Histone H2A n=1 Tax=Cyprideis torosa TaxID=163714 RepID=A0A7R8WNQ1_9CRUS|nr:unnamed protein product [Cyprideis torosa]CAG0904952.1 unnamed protein product [Cyprideis torosa]
MAPVPSKLPVRPGFNRKRRSKSSRAGLVFPVSRFRRALKAKTTSRQRVGELASVYAASVMEYLTAEVLDICGQTAKQLHQKRLTPRHVRMTINGDLDFDEVRSPRPRPSLLPPTSA